LTFKTAGPDLFEARVASGSNGGSIELRIDSLNGQKIGTCTVQGTGGWQNWVTKSCDVINVTGKHDLFFKFTGGNGLLFNFNWWKFSSSTGIRSKTGNKAGYANEIKITVDNKIVRKMHLDFSPSYLHGVVSVSLYDVTGRQAGILYKNRLFSQQLSLPIEQNSLKTGTYLVRVSVNEKMVLTKKIKF